MTESTKYSVHVCEGIRWVMPDDVPPFGPEYEDDPLAYFTEYSIGHCTESTAYSFWGIATCEINPKTDIIQLVVALAEVERISGV